MNVFQSAKALTLVAVGWFIGYGGALYFTDYKADEAIASLVGTALGAAVTVGGSLWLASWQMKKEKREIELYVSDAVKAIWGENYYLTQFVNRDSWDDNQQYATLLFRQVQGLQSCIEFYSVNKPMDRINDYSLKRLLADLDREIERVKPVLQKEVAWLSKHPTKHVIENSKGDLTSATEELLAKCDGVLVSLNANLIIPTKEKLQKQETYLLSMD